MVATAAGVPAVAFQAAAEGPEAEAQVQAGNPLSFRSKTSRIVESIAEAETRTTAEIRVHLSRRWIERSPMARARKIFIRFGMDKTANRNAVLLYVNLRRHKFAIYGDTQTHAKLGQHYWEKIARELSLDLHSTHHENAIGLAIKKLGNVLASHFPLAANTPNSNELSNDVSED